MKQQGLFSCSQKHVRGPHFNPIHSSTQHHTTISEHQYEYIFSDYCLWPAPIMFNTKLLQALFISSTYETEMMPVSNI